MAVAKSKSPQRTKFDRKGVTNKLIEADEFIGTLIKLLPPHLNQTEHSPENKKKDQKNKLAGEKPTMNKTENIYLSEGINKISLRGKSLDELQQKLEELKGKKKSYSAKLLQKGLKNRIKKKLCKEERKKKRLEREKLKSLKVKSKSKDKSKEDGLAEPDVKKRKAMEAEETESDNSESEIINENDLDSSDTRVSGTNSSLVLKKKTKSKVKQRKRKLK